MCFPFLHHSGGTAFPAVLQLTSGLIADWVWFSKSVVYLTSAPLRDSLFDLGGYFSSQLVSSFKCYLSSPQSLPCCPPPPAVLFFPSSGSMSHWLHQRDGSPSSFPSSWCLPGHGENQMWDGVSCFRGVRGGSCMYSKSSPELYQWHLLHISTLTLHILFSAAVEQLYCYSFLMFCYSFKIFSWHSFCYYGSFQKHQDQMVQMLQPMYY